MSRRDSVSAKDILAHFQTTYVTSEETVAAAVPLNHQERGWNVVSAFIYLLAVILSVIFHLLIAFESLVIRVIPMLLPSCLTQLPVWKYLQTSDKAWPPPTVVGLAALTVIALIVHPDGHTWVLLRKLRCVPIVCTFTRYTRLVLTFSALVMPWSLFCSPHPLVGPLSLMIMALSCPL